MRDTRKTTIRCYQMNLAKRIAVINRFYRFKLFKRIIMKSIYLVLATLVLICVYVAIRFKWICTSCYCNYSRRLILVSFVIFTQMEFSSITIAVLTIVGSINDTVVILDRIRENIKISGLKSSEIWDLSQTEMLSMKIITTATTMLAVLALYIFVLGQMKDFALVINCWYDCRCLFNYLYCRFVCMFLPQKMETI